MTKIVTNERDDKIALFRKLAAELGAPTMPDLHIGIRLVDKDGTVLEDRLEQGHSWTRNAWTTLHQAMLHCNCAISSFAGLTSYSKGVLGLRYKDGGLIDNTSNVYFQYKYADTDSSRGLMVGTSAETFTSEDFCLYGPISSGAGAGQLSYLTMTWTNPVLDAATNTFSQTCSRVFNNNSSAAIVVREVGLGNANNLLLSRDVLSSPINVPVGAQLTISVVVTSGSFNALDATSVSGLPALGAATQGGIYVGPWHDESGSARGWPAPFNHIRYGLIVSPAAGDSVSPLQWRTANTALTGTQDPYDGSKNMAALYALGAASPVGQFAASANSANLGGYSDWYVPSYYEMYYGLYPKLALLTGTNALANANHWTSFSNSGQTDPIYVNPITLAATASSMTSSYRVRLVRRAKMV
jgi:hypothetical protein